jgi:transposase
MLRLDEFMDIFALREVGHTISAISRMMDKDPKTIRKYLKQGRSNPPINKKRYKPSKRLEPYKPYILRYLKDEERECPPGTAIYEQIVKIGYHGSLSMVQKYITRYKREHFPPVVIRYETLPGEQAQVDWGEKKIKDNITGIIKKVHIFCMTLGYSRTRFTCLFPRADMYHFLLGHKLAFAYFKGIPKEILYDQNRCVLLKPGIKDPTLNSRFLDFARHYGFTPRLCRPYRPQTKGKVENTVKYVKKNFLSVQNTNDLNVLNRRARNWLEKVNNTVHSTTQEIPSKRLGKEDLTPIGSVAEYDLYYLETRRVFNDSTFSFQNNRFSVPPQYIGKTITIKHRPSNLRIDVFYNEQFITQHRLDSGEKYVIKRAHRHSLWKVWRNDKKLFYQQAQEMKNKNHPLALYEQVSQLEMDYGCPTVN